MNPAGYSPEKGEQVVGTPDDFLSAVESRWGRLGFDLACDGENNVLGIPGFTPEENALERIWPHVSARGSWNWLNPPFKNISPWVEKAGSEGEKVIILVPASIGSRWYAEHVEGKALVIPILGRMTFKGHSSPYPKDMMLIIFGLHGLVGMQPAWDWRAE